MKPSFIPVFHALDKHVYLITVIGFQEAPLAVHFSGQKVSTVWECRIVQ